MLSLIVVVLLALGTSSARVPPHSWELTEDTLVLSNIIFRHGDRTPDQISLWPSNPFYNESYYSPPGFGQLTNQGKRTEYKIGLALRKRYNNFLGSTWDINVLEPRSTNYNRTKMSLQLLLAGLYPPNKQQTWWPGFDWQPIPYNYLPFDLELQGSIYCSKALTLLSEVFSSAKFQAINEENQWVYDIFNTNTGENLTSIYTTFSYYFGLLVQEQLGFPLEEWTKSIYPEPLRSIGINVYYAMTNTTALRKFAAGYFLKKVIADAKAKINGTLSPSGRKLFLYSGHEYNVANTLSALDLFDGQIPNYGSYVLIELHKVGDVYGIQLLHQNYQREQPKLLTLPGCTSFCPFDRFVALTEEIIPEENEC